MTDCTACCTADVDNRKNVLQVEKYDINIMDDAVESFLKSMENIGATFVSIYHYYISLKLLQDSNTFF